MLSYKPQPSVFRLFSLCLGAGLLLAATGCSRGRQRDLDVLPESLPDVFALRGRERPRHYEPVMDSELLERAGITENPGYVLTTNERVAAARTGGVISVLGLYGVDNEIRLVVNSIYFAEAEEAERFREVQESRSRPVAGFRMEAGRGLWLIFVAKDPELAYTAEELDAIRAGLERFTRRLNLEPLFDQFTGDA